MDRNLALYAKLADRAKDTQMQVPAAHCSLFEVSETTEKAYQVLYVDQQGIERPRRRPTRSPTCKYCEDFHLSHLKQIDKTADIHLGNLLEQCFQDFLNEKLEPYELICERADTQNFHMPDFVIIADGDPRFYFEFKVIFRPFIKISSHVRKEFECYSNSLTLDVSDGMKLVDQRRLVEQIGTDKVAYVYWYDLPCIKGIFWMMSGDVYQIFESQEAYDRKHVAGDFSRGRKHGATKKIYLPLLEMNDFVSFLRYIVG